MKSLLQKPPYAIDEISLKRDTTVEFFNSSGPGGQNKNKTQTAVRLKHLPSGLIVIATRERSLRDNLGSAFDRLKERLVRLNYIPPKRRPTRPTKNSVEQRIKEKVNRAKIKNLRQKPEPEH